MVWNNQGWKLQQGQDGDNAGEEIMAMIISIRATNNKSEEYGINFRFDEPFSKKDIHEKTRMLTESVIRTLEQKENIVFID